MKKVSKIIIICVLITITLSTIFFLNRKEIKHNGMFAIMLETSKGTGKYDYAKDNKWPQSDEYVINMYKTYCEKGSVLRWNNETKRINATVKGTDKCYVYFDLSEYGNEEHPYLIQTIEDLVRLSNDVNGGTTYAGKYFLLTNDLDFQDEADYENANRVDFKDINGINGDEALITELTTGSGFVPIGNSQTNSFRGIFDGNNKNIDNLFIDNTKKNGIGLFGYVQNTKINNLSIGGVIKSQILADIGGLVGVTYGDVLLNNVHNNILLSNVSEIDNTDSNVGGLVGYIYNGSLTISNSVNHGTITANSAYAVGGIVGGRKNNNTITLNIKDSYNDAKIISNSPYLGGILGRNLSKNILVNVHNSGDLINNLIRTSAQTFCGGLGGTISAGLIKDSYNNANIQGCNKVGGLSGYASGDLIIDKSYNLGSVSGNEYSPFESAGQKMCSGGLFGSTDKIHIINSYNKGNISAKYISNDNVIYGHGGGLIGFAQTNVNIINSFNEGDVLGIAGLLYMGGGITNLSNGNNIFNIGKVNENLRGRMATISIYQNKSPFNAQNMYYWDESSSHSSNEELNATPKTLLEMKSQAFVDELNKNIENINLEEINESLKGYTLSQWVLGEDGYPTLVN